MYLTETNAEDVMNATVAGGEVVQILTSGGEVDPNTYNVKYVKHGLVGLTCKETGITVKVNNQRIHRIIKQQENIMNNESTAVIDETTIETPEFAASTAETLVQPEKVKKVKTPKAPPAKIDFDSIVENGFEVWTKTGLTLGDDPKVSAIQVAAHCVIDPEGTEDRGYEVFNSYNGTRGAKGKGGKRYGFSEKMTVEKKRKTLEKKGYIQHTV
jgi:hypothetical protein